MRSVISLIYGGSILTIISKYMLSISVSERDVIRLRLVIFGTKHVLYVSIKSSLALTLLEFNRSLLK